MKTVKFLGMLLTAFTLSFTLTACGDDDDDNQPANGNNGEQQANVFKIGNQSVALDNATWEVLDFNADDQPRYQCIAISGKQQAMIRIGFWAIIKNGEIPTGTFRLDKDGNAAVYGYCGIGGDSYNFSLNEEGNGSLVIKKQGDVYTVTINPIVFNPQDEGDKIVTSLEYKGKIEAVNHYEEQEHKPMLTLGDLTINSPYAFCTGISETEGWVGNELRPGIAFAIYFCETPEDMEIANATNYIMFRRLNTTDPLNEIPTGTFGPDENDEQLLSTYYMQSYRGAKVYFDHERNYPANVTITKDGDEYIITSDPILFSYCPSNGWDYNPDDMKQAEATFYYRGSITLNNAE